MQSRAKGIADHILPLGDWLNHSFKAFQAGRTKVPLCSTGLQPLRGRCPASPHSDSQPCKAGQRVSLTTYCPWATCFTLSFFCLLSFCLNHCLCLCLSD